MWSHRTFENQCRLAGNFRGLAQKECNLNTKERKVFQNIPITFLNFFGYDSHLSFEKLFIKAIYLNNGIKGQNILAKSCENNKSTKINHLKSLHSDRYLVEDSDNLSVTLNKLPSLDSNGKADELFRMKIAY